KSLHTLRGDRVDDLPVGGVHTIPPKMSRQIMWGFCLPGPDDEPQPSIIKFLEVLRRQHPRICCDDHVCHLVSFLEGFDHGNDRVRLCLRSFEAPALEWEPGPVDEESDDDVRVDTAFFRV